MCVLCVKPYGPVFSCLILCRGCNKTVSNFVGQKNQGGERELSLSSPEDNCPHSLTVIKGRSVPWLNGKKY